MENNHHCLQQLRRCQQRNKPLKRQATASHHSSTLPTLKKAADNAVVMTLIAAFFGLAAGAIGAMSFPSSHPHEITSGAIGAVLGAVLGALIYGAWPAVLYFWQAACSSQPVEREFFQQFRMMHLSICWVSSSAWFTLIIAYVAYLFGLLPELPLLPNPQRLAHPQGFELFHDWAVQISLLFVYGDWAAAVVSQVWPVWAICLGGSLAAFMIWRYSAPTARQAAMGGASDEAETNPFRLWLGASTGRLAQLGHHTNLAPNQPVSLTLEDAAQNILILGAIGSGKTTRVVQPLLLQLLDQRCGGLIFDIKGDFHRAVDQFAQQTGQSIITVGPEHAPLNLLAGLNPEMASSFLKSALLLAGKQQTDSFWVDSATELCRNSLGLLSFFPAHYSLNGLYRWVYELAFRRRILDDLEGLRPQLSPKQARSLKTYESYFSQVYDAMDARVQQGIQATAGQILSPFSNPELTDAFCTATTEQDSPALTEVLNGAVFLVSLPSVEQGLGAKVVYTLIKLRFYHVMQSRAAQANSSAWRPVFFLCDEFQEIVSANRDGLSDLNFWDKSRSSKTIGIISAQSVSSFYAAVGNRDLVDALCQNFRQKICFRTEDATTLQYFQTLADKVEVSRRTTGESTGTHEQGGRGSNTSRSQSESTSWMEKHVLTAQVFRQLSPNQAVALLSIEGQSADDVLEMTPVYVSSSVTLKET